MKFQFKTQLDLGDLGMVEADAYGFVSTCGLFGDGSGYHKTEIEQIIAHIPLKSGETLALDIPLNKLSKAAEVSIHGHLETLSETERRGA